MITRFEIIQPVPLLRNYIERMFIIETSGRMPSNDLKLIVPNGCAKMVIPFKNSLVGHSSQWKHISRQNKIGIIGISDISAMVDYGDEGPSGNITIEFSPLGLYRFFNFQWKEITNQIYDLDEVLGPKIRSLENLLVNTETIKERIAIVQNFLIQNLSTHSDPIFDYCINEIIKSKGIIKVKQLEKYTGYSSRWLNVKFIEKIGISPKNLSSIIRFQQYYKSLITNSDQFFLEKEFYNYYHDQSHFIKDFKRFTGHPPLFLAKAENNYDKVFYKD